jgi:glycosyltransferase involved in cell wall biosynthesis
MADRRLIAFDASSVPPRPAGAGVYTLQLIRALTRLDSEHEYVVYARSHAVPMLEGLGPRCTVVDIGKKSRAARLLWEQVALPLDLRRRGARLLHSPHHTAPFWAPCPRVVTLHDVTFFILPERYPLIRRLYFQVLTILAARRAKAVLVPSASVAEEARPFLGIPSSRLAVTHEGVDEVFRRIEPEAARAVAERYGLPEGYLLSLGTREPGKNREAILWAMRYLLDLGFEPHLAVVGQAAWGAGDEGAMVERLGLEGRVHFTGYVDQADLPAIYSAASVFVFPSLHEGFGLPVLEAMACGTPVVTSATSSLPEVAGDAAVLVDPRDAHAIADAIARIWGDADEAERLRRAGIERASKFSWDACAEATLAVYRRVLDEA